MPQRDDDEYGAYKIVARQPWPFPCDPDELPATPLRLTQPDRGFYPHSILQPSHATQVMLNWAMTFYNTDVFNSSGRFISYNKCGSRTTARSESLRRRRQPRARRCRFRDGT